MTQKEKEYVEYLENTLVYLQENLTGLTKIGYPKENLLNWIEERQDDETGKTILEDIEGMDVAEIKEYINKYYIKK